MSLMLLLLFSFVLIATRFSGSVTSSVLPDPDPETIQTHTFLPASSPPSTIPAFPEQSNVAGCPLDLPEELFSGIKSACGPNHHKQPDPDSYSGRLHRNRCCPVLAAWLYSAYSKTALDRTITKSPASNSQSMQAAAAEVDMPLLPDDSETCVEGLEKALSNKGIELVKPNGTCDVLYCYCNIRLHPFSCPQAFSVNHNGDLVGGKGVKRLEKDCLSNNGGGSGGGGYGGLSSCSKCLNSLYMLAEDNALNGSKSDERSRKMRSKDCELMGITWLLNKDRSAYIHTVSAVLRAIMMSTDGSDPRSCALNSDGMPLAVDSSEISDPSSGTVQQISRNVFLLSSLCMSFMALFSNY